MLEMVETCPSWIQGKAIISIQRRLLFYLSSDCKPAFFRITSLRVIREAFFLLPDPLDFYVYVYPCGLTAWSKL